MKALPNIGLYIDLENMMYRKKFKVASVIKFLESQGQITISKAYADWGQFAKEKRQMEYFDVQMVNLPKGNKEKNCADMKLTVDVMEDVFTRPEVDTFVIVSGDKDFIPLVIKLKTHNKRVIVIGREKETTSSHLLEHADQLVYYKNISPMSFIDKEDIKSAFLLLLQTMEDLKGKGIKVTGSQVKQFMKKRETFFNELRFGFSRFREFLKHCQEKGIVQLNTLPKGNDVELTALISSEKMIVDWKASKTPKINLKKLDLRKILPFNQSCKQNKKSK